MGGCSKPQGKGSLQLSFTAIMGHVRLISSPLFTHKRCVSWPENDITSWPWAIDWATGPRGVLTDAPLIILTGAPLTLASDSCVFQTGKMNGGLNFHQSHQGVMWPFQFLTTRSYISIKVFFDVMYITLSISLCWTCIKYYAIVIVMWLFKAISRF